MKYFQFNPADYNTTSRIVSNLHHGKTIPTANGTVLIEYLTDDELISLFFRIQVHVPSPADVDPPVDPKEQHQRNITGNYGIVVSFIAVAMFITAIIIVVMRYCKGGTV